MLIFFPFIQYCLLFWPQFLNYAYLKLPFLTYMLTCANILAYRKEFITASYKHNNNDHNIQAILYCISKYLFMLTVYIPWGSQSTILLLSLSSFKLVSWTQQCVHFTRVAELKSSRSPLERGGNGGGTNYVRRRHVRADHRRHWGMFFFKHLVEHEEENWGGLENGRGPRKVHQTKWPSGVESSTNERNQA